MTRRKGTPLTLNGPETNKVLSSKAFKYTTRLPLKRPANKIKTVPGTKEGRNFCGREDFLVAFGTGASSAGYHFGAYFDKRIIG